MPPFCRVRLLTGDEHAHSFCGCVARITNLRSMRTHFAAVSIRFWAYPRETKTNNGNFKNAAILPSKVAYS